MRKYSKKELKNMIKSGVVIDLTHATMKDYHKIIQECGGYIQIGYMSNIYGCTGKVLKGIKNNQIYIITAPTAALYIF